MSRNIREHLIRKIHTSLGKQKSLLHLVLLRIEEALVNGSFEGRFGFSLGSIRT